MDEKQIIDNMSKTIKVLSEENEELKTKVEALQLTTNLSENSYNATLDKAKEMIVTCNELIAEYKEVISATNKAKEEYESAKKEFYRIKKEYQKKMEDIIKQI